MTKRVVAIVAVHNEERFIGGCIEHFVRNGVGVYVIDNESEDRSASIARSFEGRGLVGLESLPRAGQFDLRGILRRVESLACEIDADWFIHADADERRGSPWSHLTLAQALGAIDHAGFNAANFVECTFVPTREAPDHDHEHFEHTMGWYYPFVPCFPHRLNAWKRTGHRVDLASSGGHQVAFPGLKWPVVSFPMRHYLFLSRAHAIAKYVGRTRHPDEVALAWARERSAIRPADVVLTPQAMLRPYRGDDQLDASDALRQHPVFEPSFWRLFLGDAELRVTERTDWRCACAPSSAGYSSML